MSWVGLGYGRVVWGGVTVLCHKEPPLPHRPCQTTPHHSIPQSAVPRHTTPRHASPHLVALPTPPPHCTPPHTAPLAHITSYHSAPPNPTTLPGLDPYPSLPRPQLLQHTHLPPPTRTAHPQAYLSPFICTILTAQLLGRCHLQVRREVDGVCSCTPRCRRSTACIDVERRIT